MSILGVVSMNYYMVFLNGKSMPCEILLLSFEICVHFMAFIISDFL